MLSNFALSKEKIENLINQWQRRSLAHCVMADWRTAPLPRRTSVPAKIIRYVAQARRLCFIQGFSLEAETRDDRKAVESGGMRFDSRYRGSDFAPTASSLASFSKMTGVEVFFSFFGVMRRQGNVL